MKDWRFAVFVFGFGGATIVVITALCLMGPFFEARTFRKLTGKSVTIWDAMWVELRVDGCR